MEVCPGALDTLLRASGTMATIAITSRQAQPQLRQFMPVVCSASSIEVHSAVTGSDQLRDLATSLLDSHDSRGAGGLQLAAALVWCQQGPTHWTFICGDQRLSKSAAAAAFAVVELS